MIAALVVIVALSVGTGSWLVMIGIPAGPIQLVAAIVCVLALASSVGRHRKDPS